MKVLILTNLYPSTREPTRGTFHHNLFTELGQQCELRIVSPLPCWVRLRRPKELFQAPCEDFTGIEASFPTYWSIPRLTFLHGQGMYASLRRHVAKLRRSFPFDVILAAWAYPDAVAAARLAQEFGCPLVTKVLGSDINELARDPALRKQIRWALQSSYRTLAVSGALQERVVELGIPRERVVMHHNGVNGEQFTLQDQREVRDRLGLTQDRPLVCYVGNFTHEKGVDVLVEAMNDLGKLGRPDVDLVMVGSGSLEAALRATARQRGLEARIRFAGRRLHSEIPDWISASDVFCLPSRREGCPNVVLEGLASGRPVVATRVGGVPELIHTGNGILVPSEDPMALAAGLKQALEQSWDPDALRSSVESLSWHEIGRELYDILKGALVEERIVSQELIRL
jgi:glycosyltransferase involved in cell wall biosynthesis